MNIVRYQRFPKNELSVTFDRLTNMREELDRVFEPFHRGEPSRNRETGGVGLGLPIARNIMRAHGGDVVIANRPAGGVKATVTLPV